MKKFTAFLSCLILGIALLGIISCEHEKAVDYSSMHVYQPEELRKIIDNASKIELAGKQTVQKSDNPADSSFSVVTTQIYKVYVNLSEDNRIVSATDETTTSERKATGPIIITSSCEMMCTPVRPGESCNVEGCMPTDNCGCTQGSCGNNCTTDIMCKQGLAGFGFGNRIIF